MEAKSQTIPHDAAATFEGPPGALVQPRVLIEEWLPVAEIGIESRRERSTPSPNAFPHINQLHVWWARRPLVASAGVVLGGVLPAWTPELQQVIREWIDDHTSAHEQRANVLVVRPAAKPQRQHLEPTRDWYHDWYLNLLGVLGDPVAARLQIDAAKISGTRLEGNGYGYPQAFRNPVQRLHIELLHYLLRLTWGQLPTVLDSTAGGGSIPFESARYGLPTIANDLNGVAAAVLEAGVQAPALLGSDLTPHLKEWGNVLVTRLEHRLQRYFPLNQRESVIAYIWANAVTCPRTGRLIPLLKSKWLRKVKGQEAAVELRLDDSDGNPLSAPEFHVVLGPSVNKADADIGFVSRGAAVSPYDQLVVDGDYIRVEAQAGRMTQVLFAIAVRTASGKRTFRSPNAVDLDAIAAADGVVQDEQARWIADGLLPTEEFPHGNDMRPVIYGMDHWADMFTPRQLLAHVAFVEEFQRLVPEVREQLGLVSATGDADTHLADQVLVLLALMQGKALNYNSRLASWHAPRQVMRSVFDRHDFAFKWDFAEFEGAHALWSWALEQLLFSYTGLAKTLEDVGADAGGGRLPREVTVLRGNAATLVGIDDRSVHHLCLDPPYYDNVMYAELSDFFYVWEKRTLGTLCPEFFQGDLADKENEAVANPARFAAMGARKKELATADYEAKMTAIFAEGHRVLTDDGVLTVMFTHKKADAWDTLGMALIQAGFTIETSWPVNTEAEHSMHQADKNSAASTIMLVCRKRVAPSGDAMTFLDEIAADIRDAAREATLRFDADGIRGVDLMLSTYGPALSVISSQWPVYSSEPDEYGSDRLLRPDEALEIAREEVVAQRRARLVGRAVQVDDLTDFVLMAWDQFQAREFPYDPARLLALAVGGQDVEELVRAKILTKKSGTVTLSSPKQRLRRSGDSDALPGVRPDAVSFSSMIDALDTVLYVAEVDGLGPAKALMDRAKLTDDSRYLAAVQGMVNAMPRVKTKDGWSVPEAGLLDSLCSVHLPSITRPEVIDLTAEPAQDALFDQR